MQFYLNTITKNASGNGSNFIYFIFFEFLFQNVIVCENYFMAVYKMKIKNTFRKFYYIIGLSTLTKYFNSTTSNNIFFHIKSWWKWTTYILTVTLDQPFNVVWFADSIGILVFVVLNISICRLHFLLIKIYYHVTNQGGVLEESKCVICDKIISLNK